MINNYKHLHRSILWLIIDLIAKVDLIYHKWITNIKVLKTVQIKQWTILYKIRYKNKNYWKRDTNRHLTSIKAFKKGNKNNKMISNIKTNTCNTWTIRQRNYICHLISTDSIISTNIVLAIDRPHLKIIQLKLLLLV
jgi:hypothetical protein